MWLAILVVVVIYFYYKKQNEEKILVEAQKPENEIKAYEESANHFKNLILDEKSFRLVSIPNWQKKAINVMENWYIELSVKDKHNLQKALEHAKDWKDYIYFEWDSANEREMLDVSNSSEESDLHWEEISKLHIKTKELFKRFANQVGADVEKKLAEIYEE